MFKYLSLLFLLFFSGQLFAASLSAEQMLLLNGLSTQEKQNLAEQAGLGSMPQKGSPQSLDQTKSTIQRKMNVNDVDNLSSIEASVWKRLGIRSDELKLVDRSSSVHNNDNQSPEGERQSTSQPETLAQFEKQVKEEKTNIEEEVFDANKIWDSWLSSADEKKSDKRPVFQFGYSLFAGMPTTFFPAAEIPVPANYVMGPGDELNIQFYGKKSDSIQVVLDRSGLVEIPEIGGVRLAGLSFVDAKALIADEVRKKAVGVSVSISMGRLRSVRIFVLGDVNHPGSYLVSSLSSMSHALFVAGGVSKQGSLRHIYLKRKGKIVSSLDLYDFLLKGDSSGDRKLLEGDVVFVAPIGKTVTAYGEVNRPAIYELKNERTVSDIVRLAGSLTSNADRKHEQIERLNSNGGRILIDLSPEKTTKIKGGDIVIIHSSPAVEEAYVELLGEVKRPGKYGYKKGMRLDDVLGSKDDLLLGSYAGFVLIQHIDATNGQVSVKRVVLSDLFAKSHKEWPLLNENDKIYVFPQKLLNPSDYVTASGEFLKPGKYPLGKKMTLLNLVVSAGGLSDKAYLKEVEVARYAVVNGEKRSSEYLKVNLVDILSGHEDFKLQAYDEVLVRKISQWDEIAKVEILGEVNFPSTYPVEDGEKLSDLIKRAGGFTDKAYLKAAVFTRESIREEQQKQIDDMANRMEVDIAQEEEAIATLHDAILIKHKQSALIAAKRVLGQMKAVKAAGRLVIKIKDVEWLEDSEFNLTLRDGDKLFVPKKPDQVMVMGQVYNTTALLYRKKYDLDDYVDAAGGMTRLADDDRVYVVRASGFVERSGWGSTRIYPGDVIIVPEKLDQFNLLDSTLDWSRVLMQVGVGLASMKTIGVF